MLELLSVCGVCTIPGTLTAVADSFKLSTVKAAVYVE